MTWGPWGKNQQGEKKEKKHDCILYSWWFQPIWKTQVKLDHFPNFRGENRHFLRCHHLVSLGFLGKKSEVGQLLLPWNSPSPTPRSAWQAGHGWVPLITIIHLYLISLETEHATRLSHIHGRLTHWNWGETLGWLGFFQPRFARSGSSDEWLNEQWHLVSSTNLEAPLGANSRHHTMPHQAKKKQDHGDWRSNE